MSSLDLIQNLLRSKTFFGVVVLIVGMVFKGVDPNALTDQIYSTLLLITDAFGAVMILWGRITAKGPMVDIKPADQPIKLYSPSPPKGGAVG